MHRDVKPENIMVTQNDELKIIDFGLSKNTVCNKKIKIAVGTPYYMAPEVINGYFDSKCDMWSMGVLMYIFLCGYLPFQGARKTSVFRKIKSTKFHYKHKEFRNVS